MSKQMLSGATIDGDRLVFMSLTSVKLGPLSAGHDGSHAGLRGHPSHRVNLEGHKEHEYGLTKKSAAYISR